MTEQHTTGPRPKPDEVPDSLDFASLPDVRIPPKNAECEYAPRVSAYHDGEVSEVEARELFQHVANCQACAAQLAFFGKLSSTFEAAPVSRLGADARQRLEELGEQFQVGRRRIKPTADVRWARRLTAAAAVLFVVAAGRVVYEHNFAVHDPVNVTPAVSPHDPLVPPLPQPVSENRSGGSQSSSPRVADDGKTPAVTETDFVAGRSAPKSPATGQTEKP